jgi:hypothetical protein
VSARRLIPLLLLLGGTVAAIVVLSAGDHAGNTSASTPLRDRPRPVVCGKTVYPSEPVDEIAKAIVGAADGNTVCMAAGSYPVITVLGASHHAYVTIRPAGANTSVTVAGMEVRDSSFLRFEGLHMSEGFNMRDSQSAASHDYQFIADSFENAAYGIVLYGGSGPIRKVRIEGNYMRNIDFPGAACDSGYAGGQAVTLFNAEDVTIAHNVFKEVSWHYIQGGGAGPGGVRIEHNLFEGPIPADRVACTHLNVWQIWQGGVNDTFSDNVVLGTPGHPAAITPILFETGPGGSVCADAMSATTISNNLFVDDAAAYSVQVMTTAGLTLTHNTVIGSTYGTIVYKTPGCPPGSDYDVRYNIDALNRGNAGRSPDMSLGACRGHCQFEYNVSSDGTAARAPGARHSVVYWRPNWFTTSWGSLVEHSPPAGYYVPRRLRVAAGYRPSGH